MKNSKKIKILVRIIFILLFLFIGITAVANFAYWLIDAYYQYRINDLRNEVVEEYPFTPRKLTDRERKEFGKGNAFQWDCPSGNIKRNFYYEKGVLEEKSEDHSFPFSFYTMLSSKQKYEYFLGLQKEGRKITILPPGYGPADEECPGGWELFVYWRNI